MSRRERAERDARATTTGPRTATGRSTGEEVAELIPALAARDPSEAYLFYDCQTDDVRLVLTILGEAERFGAVSREPAPRSPGCSTRRAGRRGGLPSTRETGEAFEVEADNVINATGVWADRIRPEEIHDEAEVPRIAPEPRHPRDRCRSTSSPLDTAACIVPAGEERTIFALPWYGRALIGTTDNDYDGDIAHVQPGARRHRLPARRGQRLLRHSTRRRRPHRRLRRRPAADLDRRPAQVGRHLAQGRALRDLLGDADDHRRQADDLAADGEAGRRPDGRARGPGRALPHRRHPARDGGLGGRARPARRARGVRPARRLPRAARASATATPAATCSRSRASGPSSRRPIVDGQPDMLAEVVIAARLEQARSVGDVLLRRTRLGLLAAPQLRTADSVAAGRRGARRASSAGTTARRAPRPSAGSSDARGRGDRPGRRRVGHELTRVVDLDSLEADPARGAGIWRPVRRALGVTAFGINAYSAERAGAPADRGATTRPVRAPAATRSSTSSPAGAATFEIDGERVDAPEGSDDR